MQKIAISWLAFTVVATQAQGQHVTQWRLDDGSAHHRGEPALRVSQFSRDVIVAWMHFLTVGSMAEVEVRYRVSVDGNTFASPAGCDRLYLPVGAETTGADPMVAFGQGGVGWIGYLQGGSSFVASDRFWISRKGPGAICADAAVGAYFPPGQPSSYVDKGVLVAGPGPTGQVLGLVFTRQASGSWYRMRAIASPDLGLSWNPDDAVNVGQDHQDGNEGGPNSAVILRSGGFANRWVVGYHSRNVPPQTSDPLRARAVWSPDGATWFNSVSPTAAVQPCAWPLTEAITGVHPTDPVVVPPGGPYVLNSPSLAVDPRDSSVVYLAFLGRTPSQGMNNVDLFIARSGDGGQDFSQVPGLPAGSAVLHLRDQDLGDPPGAIQFLPSIAVNAGGGVGVAYTAAWLEGQTWKYRVKIVYINPFSVIPHPSPCSPNDPPNLHFFNLTPVFDLVSTRRHLRPCCT
jgi:hypothetical protein